VVVNSADNTVSVLEGLPNGTFGTAQALATGINPVSAVVGDFNGDGYTDIAVANNNNGGAGTVSVILGNPGGDEFFASQVTYPVDAGPIGLVTGDFNGDGILDLVTTNEASSTLSVLLGVGDGTFGAAITTPLPTGAQASFLSTADLRNNGTLDLVMATPNAPDVYVLLGNNDGTFQAAVDYPMGAGALSVAVGDLNGDGILDLAVPDLNTGAVSTKLGNGDGTFGASSTVMIGPGTFHLELADLNGDGLLDYVVADPNTATVSIALQAHTETAIAAGVAVTGA
ncbi:MAG: VCBS repeat-containing protein, partial [Candidatus Acidiferrum sp.]